MEKELPDFNELVASLAKRGVIVKASANYSPRNGIMRYNAVVALDSFQMPMGWPNFEFTVYGRELNELADDILMKLPLVEPIIAATEKQRKHKEAVEMAARAGDELRDALLPQVEPNTDPATMKEQQLVAANDPGERVRTILRHHGQSAVSIATLIHSGVLTSDEVRNANGLPIINKAAA